MDVQLVGPFAVRAAGRQVDLPVASRRLLAYLALEGHPQRRAAVAATLWPGAPPTTCRAALRRGLVGCRRVAPDVVGSSVSHLWLGGGVRVDHPGLLERPAQDLAADVPAAVEGLCTDLLADWDEDWAVRARRRHRLCRLDRLEELSGCLARAGRYPEALDVAMVAVVEEPRRTSAHRRVVEVHLAEGHVGEAVRHVRRFAALLADEAGAPHTELLRLVERRSNVRALAVAHAPVGPGASGPPVDDHLARALHPAGKGRRADRRSVAGPVAGSWGPPVPT